MGLSFESPVELNDNLEIRPVSDFEKELALNAPNLGGGSVALRRVIVTGNLTHAAVYTVERVPDGGWNSGMSVASGFGKTVYEELETLQTALRLCYPGQFEMGIWHMIDKTFYPVVVSSHEEHGMSLYSSTGEPDTIRDEDRLKDYYQKVSKVNEDVDEGLRVAIDRLESSSRKTSNADGVVDAVIGIEALLSSGRSGRFQEVRRRAAVLSKEKATYSELGHLQNLRNATVHGTETRVDRSDLEEAQELLSTLISRTIELMIERDISRETIVKEVDAAIERVIQEEFMQTLSAFYS